MTRRGPGRGRRRRRRQLRLGLSIQCACLTAPFPVHGRFPISIFSSNFSYDSCVVYLVAELQKQAVWALGNVAGDSPKWRDLVLGSGGLFPLLQQLNEQAKLSMLRNATWTLSRTAEAATCKSVILSPSQI